jgi:hypothetical protein
MKNLFLSISALTLLAWSGCSHEEKLDTCYRNSVAWLWSQQGEDGGWHSKTHAVLRDGQVLTPYILYYLLQVPDSVFHQDQKAITRAIEFIRLGLVQGDTNAIAISLNYPNYSLAYALRCFVELKTDTLLERKIAERLIKEQFTSQRQVDTSSMAYGGWGYGETNMKPGDFGHVDISHTRRIIEALMAYDQKAISSENKEAAKIFLRGAQRSPEDHRLYEGCTDRSLVPYDGGFVSSMYTLSTNKCQPRNVGDCYHYPSYATATCDGLLALYALGMEESKAYNDAKQWLDDHQRIDVIEGLPEDDPEQWYLIMHYYHWAVRAEAMRAAGIHGQWEIDLKIALVKEQREDGSYINPLGGVNKEDDPLMATIFCVQAMTSMAKG